VMVGDVRVEARRDRAAESPIGLSAAEDVEGDK
jgi:hypothetical protein